VTICRGGAATNAPTSSHHLSHPLADPVERLIHGDFREGGVAIDRLEALNPTTDPAALRFLPRLVIRKVRLRPLKGDRCAFM
jgi:hypothetical protein